MTTYQINNSTYIQRPLVIGQIRQLMHQLRGIIIPRDIDVFGLLTLIGDKLPSVIAILITPDGMNPKDKDVEALATDLEFTMHPELALDILSDFFDCNPLASLFERASGIISKQMEMKKTT